MNASRVMGVWLFACGCLGAVVAVRPIAAFDQSAAGPITLFNGSSLEGWTRVGNANWRLADGVVEANSGSGFLVSKDSYADFQVSVEFWADADANSGVFIRCQDHQKIESTTSYEVNVYDKRPSPEYATGGIVNYGKVLTVVKAADRWNTFEIAARGPRITVTLNGTRTAEAEHNGHTRGPIALQYNGGTVKFRSVRIRPL